MNAVKKFIVAMLVVLGLGIVFFIGYFVKSNANLKHDARNNTECKTNERVFDYADKLAPERVVYVSCGPETLARDLKYLTKHGYAVKRATPYDCFPFTEHIETVVLLCR